MSAGRCFLRRCDDAPAAAASGDDAPPADAHRVIREGYALWRAQRPAADLLPGRQHIRPPDMPTMLPHVWLLDIPEAGQSGSLSRLRVRLAGSHVGTIADLAAAGRRLEEIEPDFSRRAAVHAPYLDAICNRRPQYRRGPPHLACCRTVAEEEILLLPLAADGQLVNMLLGFVVFYTTDGRVMPTGW